MKNIIKTGLMLATAVMISGASVYADGLVFDPETYATKADASEYSTQSKYATAPAVNTKNVTDIKNEVTRENNNMQDALFKLDSAQSDLRNQLLDQRAKYSEIDSQYKTIKEQRAEQQKLVRETEKKIKRIEKNKQQISKLMQLQ